MAINTRAAAGFFSLLYPSRCAYCGMVYNGKSPCPRCEQAVQQLREKAKTHTASAKTPHLDAFYAPFLYEDPVGNGIRRMKFKGATALLPVYAAAVAQEFTPLTPGLLVPVPSSKNSLRDRGFNLPELLTKELSRIWQMPVLSALRKDYETAAQHRLSAAARRGNLAGAFSVIDPKAIAGKHIYLCDDVRTTGATLEECAKTLRIFGAAAVTGLAIAIDL